jgi:hypothetical protein
MSDGKNDQNGSGKAEGRDLAVRPKTDRPALEAAAHAYEATEHVADPPAPHRVDLRIGEPPPRRRLQMPFGRRVVEDDEYGERESVHRLASPARTGFSVGFGAAAGVFALRAIVGLVGAAILLGLAWAALSFIFVG